MSTMFKKPSKKLEGRNMCLEKNMLSRNIKPHILNLKTFKISKTLFRNKDLTLLWSRRDSEIEVVHNL